MDFNSSDFKSIWWLDPYVMEILDILANCILVNLIGAFGVFGNIINIAVLQKHGFKESTNILLFSLSISDLLFCSMLPLVKLGCLLRYFDKAAAVTVTSFGTVYMFMPKFVAAANSFTLIAVIAAERFTAVFFPFQVANVFNTQVMKVLVIAIAVFGFLAVVPTFFAFRLEWQFDRHFNRTIAVVRSTLYYTQNKTFLDIYMWVVLCNVFCTLTMTFVLFCCVAIGIKLTRAAVKREKMTSRAAGYDVKVVRMLISVCLVYLCVQIPTISLYISFRPDFIIMLPLTKLASDTCEVLFTVNAAANFLIYVSMSEKFAKTYKRLLGLNKKPTNQPSGQIPTVSSGRNSHAC